MYVIMWDPEQKVSFPWLTPEGEWTDDIEQTALFTKEEAEQIKRDGDYKGAPIWDCDVILTLEEAPAFLIARDL